MDDCDRTGRARPGLSLGSGEAEADDPQAGRLGQDTGYAKSLREADPHDEYFEDNLATARLALELDPYTYSRGLLKEDDDTRIFMTKDRAAGYRVSIGIRIHPGSSRWAG